MAMAASQSAGQLPKATAGHIREVEFLKAQRHRRTPWTNADRKSKDSIDLPAPPPKTEEEASRLAAIMSTNETFAGLGQKPLRHLIDVMLKHEYKKGDVVVREGDMTYECFVVDAGEMSVTASGKEVGKVAAGSMFGELSLIYDVARTATVTAATDATLRAPVRMALDARRGGTRAEARTAGTRWTAPSSRRR